MDVNLRNQLRTLIQVGRSCSRSDEAILQELVNAGHSTQAIQEVFAEINAEQKAAPLVKTLFEPIPEREQEKREKQTRKTLAPVGRGGKMAVIYGAALFISGLIFTGLNLSAGNYSGAGPWTGYGFLFGGGFILMIALNRMAGGRQRRNPKE